jgi:RNA polymerase subunit RPABC4/transcription elongation factor Spt4
VTEKRCTKCGEVNNTKNTWCKNCSRSYRQAYYERNKERVKAKVGAYREAHPDKVRECNRQYAKRTKDQRRAYWLDKFYNLTPDDYDAMLEKQGGVCAVCKGGNDSNRWSRLVVDHDHENGKVRGLLCDTCNRAIGLMKDNPLLVFGAYRYLVEAIQAVQP